MAKTENTDNTNPPQIGPLKYPGLDTIDEDLMEAFIAAVEDAFEALHQPGFGPAGDEAPELPLSMARFLEWAKSVEKRLEYMGLAHIALGLPDKPTSGPLDPAALKIWTQRVWARFAAFGQVLPSPKK